MPPSVRLGPITWVPQLRSAPGDPWAHRKGEPRPLALGWSLYLLSAAGLTVLRVRSLTAPSAEQFAEAARGLLLMVLVGVSILWPMVRLSQEAPRKINRSLAVDLCVILVPAQAVIWPLPVLTHWPFSVAGGLALAVASWGVLSAGVLSAAFRWSDTLPRWGWMVVAIAPWLTALGVLVFQGAAGGGGAPGCLSPGTAAWALTYAPSGLPPVMQSWEWVLTAAAGAAGVVVWFLAGAVARRSSRG